MQRSLLQPLAKDIVGHAVCGRQLAADTFEWSGTHNVSYRYFPAGTVRLSAYEERVLGAVALRCDNNLLDNRLYIYNQMGWVTSIG